MNILERLSAEGVVIFYHDYETRGGWDWSGNNRHATFSRTQFVEGGARFVELSSYATVPSDVTIAAMTAGTMFFDGRWDYRPSNDDLYPFSYAVLMRISSSGIYTRYGSASDDMACCNSYFAYRPTGRESLTMTFSDGAPSSLYVDGVHDQDSPGNASIVASGDPVTIGNLTNNYRCPYAIFGRAALFSRRLTPSEIVELHAFSRRTARVSKVMRHAGKVSRLEMGVRENTTSMTAIHTPVVNTPISLASASDFKVVTEAVNGEVCRILRNTGAALGRTYAKMSAWRLPLTDPSAAWRFWIRLQANGASTFRFAYSSNTIGDVDISHHVELRYSAGNPVIRLKENADIRSEAACVFGGWMLIELTRAGTSHVLKLDGVQVGSMTDASYPTSRYIQTHHNSGQCDLILASEHNTYSWRCTRP